MAEEKTFYITTPIYYPSANLHIGHAYSTVAADTMARYKKLRGYETFFLTGSDEHGQKIERAAKAVGKTPIEFVNPIVANMQYLWKQLNISNDDFIRTTQERHKQVAQKLFQKIYDQGDIYKSQYEGWYCTPCETFFTQRQVGEEHICPDCGRPVELTHEESYFFKMSKYADQWMAFIESHPDFIQPETRRNEMINFVKQGLEDLCVSRTTFSWGIPVPFDDKHVIYVWFDALINYLSALGYGTEDDSLFQKFWGNTTHLVGKDIIRFHSIIWPIMLMALGLPLPQKVFGHGWVLIDNGKMSKSKGNVVDPLILVDKYGSDALRYFLMREMPMGLDANYSEEALVTRINVDLANDYGNLLSRTTAMIDKFQGGFALSPSESTEYDDDLIALAKATPDIVGEYMDKMEFSNALGAIWKLINRGNKYIDEVAPWALNKAGETEKLATVLYNMAEVLRMATIMIQPVMPNIAPKVWQQLGIEKDAESQNWDTVAFGNFPVGAKINRGEPLFPRIDMAVLGVEGGNPVEDAKTAMNAAMNTLKNFAREVGDTVAEGAKEIKATVTSQDFKDGVKDGVNTGVTAVRKAAGAAVSAVKDVLNEDEKSSEENLISIDDFAKVDLRVAEVIACEKVEKTDKLLKLQVKIGDEERTVVSGIALHYEPADLIGKKVVIVANLKPAKLRGIESCGMILAASQGGSLEVVEVKNIPSGGKVK